MRKRSPILVVLCLATASCAGLDARAPDGRCGNAATDLCYELRDGRVVYRGGRALMPRIEGLTAESVSVRHGGFVLRYSFR